MKVISFLGTTDYKCTTYYLGDQERQTRFFPTAVAQFVKPEKLFVCATPTVQKHENLKEMGDELGDMGVAWQIVSIPEGHSEADLWTIFDALTTVVGIGEIVTFDVTHSYRSLPVLSFLAVAYLKAAKSVKVEQVLYGAWEARDEETNRSPVFDLTPFVSLLDWLTASDRFTRFGNSADLAALVNKTGIYPKDSPLSQAVQVLSDLTQALRLIRPLDAMQISALLPEILDAAKPVAQKVPSLRPYELLVGDLKKAYTPFALANPSVPTNFKASLTKQRDLIRWYVERQQWVQAVSLAREWLITWVIWQMGETDFLNQSLRETVAEIMNKEAQRRREAKEQNLPFHSLFLRNVPGINEVLGNWLALVGIRNDIDHAGMRKKTGKATDLIKSIRTLCKKLDKLPLEQTNLP